MANEGSLDFALFVTKIPPMVSAEGLNIAGYNFNVSNGAFSKGVCLADETTLTAVPLQGITPGYAIFINTDSAHAIWIYNGNSAASDTIIAKLGPGSPAGDVALLKLDPACVPYAKADTVASNLLFIIFST